MTYIPKPLDALNNRPEVERKLGISAREFKAYEKDNNPEFEGILSELYGDMRKLADEVETRRRRLSMLPFEKKD